MWKNTLCTFPAPQERKIIINSMPEQGLWQLNHTAQPVQHPDAKPLIHCTHTHARTHILAHIRFATSGYSAAHEFRFKQYSAWPTLTDKPQSSSNRLSHPGPRGQAWDCELWRANQPQISTPGQQAASGSISAAHCDVSGLTVRPYIVMPVREVGPATCILFSCKSFKFSGLWEKKTQLLSNLTAVRQIHCKAQSVDLWKQE